jgi:hypothetical protein
MTTITVQIANRSPALAAATGPRGARWAATLLAPLFTALQGGKPARSARTATQALPEQGGAAAQNRRVREAARVRRYAMELAAVDSRVAAELMAACDRHERGE